MTKSKSSKKQTAQKKVPVLKSIDDEAMSSLIDKIRHCKRLYDPADKDYKDNPHVKNRIYDSLADDMAEDHYWMEDGNFFVILIYHILILGSKIDVYKIWDELKREFSRQINMGSSTWEWMNDMEFYKPFIKKNM